ncbi:hypothetical protein NDU88_008139 [Pleurodeles waltl]|uniref:Uncharacterized protein n=1 Tax=Pleurodeles waltl TaxID=8319 RepID=A0AAV7U1J3_PLEWA|nr:hypothetical protein NDU88_003281 [Pleurodeles waltl]KAJ1182965.1 hypothetical protein NDU88_008139 [Pleurodeles waltl]
MDETEDGRGQATKHGGHELLELCAATGQTNIQEGAQHPTLVARRQRTRRAIWAESSLPAPSAPGLAARLYGPHSRTGPRDGDRARGGAVGTVGAAPQGPGRPGGCEEALLSGEKRPLRPETCIGAGAPPLGRRLPGLGCGCAPLRWGLVSPLVDLRRGCVDCAQRPGSGEVIVRRGERLAQLEPHARIRTLLAPPHQSTSISW